MKRVQIKMPDEVYETMIFKAKALQVTNSAFVRSLILNQNIISTTRDKDYTRVLGLLGNIGGNINQISHNLNIAQNGENLDVINYKTIINQLTIIQASIEACIEKK